MSRRLSFESLCCVEMAADDVRIYIYRNRNFLSPLVVSVSRIPLLHLVSLTVVKTPDGAELKRLLQHVQRVVTRQ